MKLFKKFRSWYRGLFECPPVPAFKMCEECGCKLATYSYPKICGGGMVCGDCVKRRRK